MTIPRHVKTYFDIPPFRRLAFSAAIFHEVRHLCLHESSLANQVLCIWTSILILFSVYPLYLTSRPLLLVSLRIILLLFELSLITTFGLFRLRINSEKVNLQTIHRTASFGGRPIARLLSSQNNTTQNYAGFESMIAVSERSRPLVSAVILSTKWKIERTWCLCSDF